MGRIHPEAEKIYFSRWNEDKKVVKPFLHGFDVTYATRLTSGADTVGVFYLKPQRWMEELLGLEREMLLVYSPYAPFHARAIELHDAIATTDRVRLDPMASIIVSDAANVKEFIRQFMSKDPGRAPIVAFSTKDLVSIRDAHQLRAQIIEQTFRRDLFALESPLRNDALFFGREALLTELVDRFRSRQNSGLFGLRRMGKTSVLYAVGRRCEQDGLGGFYYFDLSYPGLYGARWRAVLQEIVKAIHSSIPPERRPSVKATRLTYSEDQAAHHFRNDIRALMKVLPGGRLLIALDEIENITFDLSPAMHWTMDFLPFWQTLRGLHQETKGDLCFILAGVNPHPVEADRVGRFDNPLFSTINTYYLRPFSRETVREMVRRLARSMGIQVEEPVYDRLTTEYGGHPFLIRQACSYLVKQLPDRPATLTKDHFEREKSTLAIRLDKNVRQILNILATWYPTEYELVRRLAQGQPDDLLSAAQKSATLTDHLSGYGLVSDVRTKPTITIRLVSEHLTRQSSPSDGLPEKLATREDVVAEVSRRRDPIERRLRVVVAFGLSMKYGDRAASKALDCWSTQRKERLAPFSYRELWQETFLTDLISVLDTEWDAFQNWFGAKEADVLLWLNAINTERIDAHAGDIDPDSLAFLRLSFRKIEEKLQALPIGFPIDV